jgi:hypothetical protein
VPCCRSWGVWGWTWRGSHCAVCLELKLCVGKTCTGMWMIEGLLLQPVYDGMKQTLRCISMLHL